MVDTLKPPRTNDPREISRWREEICRIVNRVVTLPTQPVFSAKLSEAQNNIAIASGVTILFATEVYDQGNDFDTGTYTFTAPVTGKYHFDVSLRLQNVDTAPVYYYVKIVTSNRNYGNVISPDQFAADLTYWTLNLSADADMDANDTAKVSVYQSAGTQQTDIGSGEETFFTGRLVA